MRDRLNRSGKDLRVLPYKFLELIKTPDADTWSCLAMADDVRGDEFVERIRLMAVPSLPESPDHGLDLLGGCAHSHPPSLSSLAYTLGRPALKVMIRHSPAPFLEQHRLPNSTAVWWICIQRSHCVQCRHTTRRDHDGDADDPQCRSRG